MNEIGRAIEYIENHIPMDIGECMIKALERQLKLQELGFTDDIINNYKQFEDECISKGFTFKNLIEARENQLNNGWIPCSERLPESDNWYIITVGKNRLVYCDYYDAKHREWDGYSFTDVVAWKKMPESYKE